MSALGREAPSSLSLEASATRLRLMWLASPTLPVGGFSYSEGLESAVECGLIGDEASARAWLLDQLHLSLARSDAGVMALAMRAWMGWQQVDELAVQQVSELNDWVLCTRETSELRQQTEQMGRSLLEWMRHQQPLLSDASAWAGRLQALAQLKPAPSWPVAYALAAAQTGASVADGLLSFGLSWAENMTQAAIKATPLGQTSGQRILHALVRALPEAMAHAQSLHVDDLCSHTPMLAILCAQHETQYSRLFRS